MTRFAQSFLEKWARNRDLILGTTRTILAQFTDPTTDIVLPRGDSGYVVLFTRLERDEALLRGALIKSEILKRFTGEDSLDGLDIQSQAMDLDSGALFTDGLGDLLEKVQLSASVPDGPKGAPGAAFGTQQKKVFRASLSELGAAMPAAVEELEERFGFSLDDLDFAFEPHLYLARGVFSVFSCRAVRRSATGEILMGYRVLPPDADAAQVVDLDKMILLRARHGLVDMAVRKRVAVVVVPVSFETMTSRSAAIEHLGLVQQVPADLRNYLVVSLNRCPVGVPEGRLAELISPYKRLVRAVSVRVASPRQSLAVIKGAGAFSVGFNLSELSGAEAGSSTFLPRFVASARKLRLHTFVDGVNSAAQLVECQALGLDYLAGRALAELSDYVGPITDRRAG